eukprot:TRINITY_DN5251_c0_g2_i1.p1 TRINITY_DN5251_c0_g2~~TRINITY_DN5251_c0_g2_i1.p1  ORF type:complete len:221 (+),score=39.42 TRINITY_DN5251_c0_g2_i1:65-727(+)
MESLSSQQRTSAEDHRLIISGYIKAAVRDNFDLTLQIKNHSRDQFINSAEECFRSDPKKTKGQRHPNCDGFFSVQLMSQIDNQPILFDTDATVLSTPLYLLQLKYPESTIPLRLWPTKTQIAQQHGLHHKFIHHFVHLVVLIEGARFTGNIPFNTYTPGQRTTPKTLMIVEMEKNANLIPSRPFVHLWNASTSRAVSPNWRSLLFDRCDRLESSQLENST